MKMAACGPSGGANTSDHLAHLHLVAGLDTDGLKVVVGGDEPVAVVDLHPVATAPGVPSGGAHNTGISRMDGCATGRCIILAQVEIPRRPAERTDPETERRARIEELKRCHQEACSRPAHARRAYCQGTGGVLGNTPNWRAWEGQADLRIGQDGGRKGSCTNLVRRRRSRFPLRLIKVALAGGSAGGSSTRVAPGAGN
ncbi:hypothetical protein QFZ57_000386 [Arthrobacter sp. B1I2]|nr:hypothetical protein [Arthrobacter sp. B1I2]